MKRRHLLKSLPPGYAKALTDLVGRVAAEIPRGRKTPVQMTIAGGTAAYLYVGTRASADVDATFSPKVLFSDFAASYIDDDGKTRAIYVDRNYNDTLGLMHEDAYDDATPIHIDGIDPRHLDVRLLSPSDLAVSKIARFADPDQRDIAALARAGLITAAGVRKRATQAASAYVGNQNSVETSIELACRLIEENGAGDAPIRRGRLPKQ